jgi:colanic acid biosynthesis glycosyl transferase WcaI
MINQPVVKILIVGLNFHPELTGIGRYTGELAAFLAGQGHTVRVITTPPYYPYWQIQSGYHAWQYRKESWQGVEIQRCPLWVPRHPTGFTRLLYLASFAFSSLPALIAQLQWKPSIVLCIAPSMLNAPFVLAFAYLTRAKAWLHIQDFELDAAVSLNMLPGRNFMTPWARAFERFVVTHFAAVSTISESMRLLCIKKGVKPERAFLLPNWVDTKKIYPLPVPCPLRTKLNIPDQAFVALYHGNMGSKQGLEILLETAHMLTSVPDILFVLCGEGSAKRELSERAASLPNVRFLELQPEEKLNELVNLADVHLLPQLPHAADFAMPSKLTTMLASGKVVLASSRAGTQISQVLDSIGITLQPENAKALAEALIRLYENPAERLRLGGLSRAYACRNLDREIILSRVNCLINV